MDKPKQNTTIRCGTCGYFKHGDDLENGMVKCVAGNVVGRLTRACGNYEPLQEEV